MVVGNCLLATARTRQIILILVTKNGFPKTKCLGLRSAISFVRNILRNLAIFDLQLLRGDQVPLWFPLWGYGWILVPISQDMRTDFLGLLVSWLGEWVVGWMAGYWMAGWLVTGCWLLDAGYWMVG